MGLVREVMLARGRWVRSARTSGGGCTSRSSCPGVLTRPSSSLAAPTAPTRCDGCSPGTSCQTPGLKVRPYLWDCCRAISIKLDRCP